MPTIRARQGGTLVTVTAEPGEILREALRGHQLVIRSGCNGNGSCGMCMVRVVRGEVSSPTMAEMMHIPLLELQKGYRLACQTRANGDIELELDGGREAPGWKMLPRDEGYHIRGSKGEEERSYALVLCIDVGTSRLRLSVIDSGSRARLAGASGPNPLPGLEVISRLDHAARGNGEEAARLRAGIAEGLQYLRQGAGIDLKAIRNIVVVGNTAMLALLRGSGEAAVLDPSGWTKRAERRTIPLPGLGKDIGLEGAQAEMIPPLGGFIGSDLLAGVLASGLTEDGPSILIDLGVNTEVALWTGKEMLATSAAGGSALEGRGLSCGCSATPGAVFRIHSLGDGAVEMGVIGGMEPSGLCGTGLIDALALLVDEKQVDEVGRMAGREVAVGREGGMVLTKGDIDSLQRAKGAVAASVRYLLREAGLGYEDLVRVHLAGTLGKHLDISNAIFIGLLPPLPASRYRQIENAALLGAELCALDEGSRMKLETLAAQTRFFNLAAAEGFGDLFMDSLRLRPWSGREVASSFAALGRPQEDFVRAAQYISDMRLEDDNQEKLGTMILRLFEADLAAFAEEKEGQLAMKVVGNRSPTCRACPEDLILREARVVIDSGFMSTIPPGEGSHLSIALLPMHVEDRTVVMIIGHEIPEPLPLQRLDVYLALAKSAGGILTRLQQEKELVAHRTSLSNLVEERTREAEETNLRLRQEMEMRVRDEEAIRLANNKLNLLSSMTRHDIINQITAVLGYVHLMETKGLPHDKMIRYLGKIEEITTTIQRLIEFTRDYQDLGVRGPTWQQIDDDFWKAAVAFRDSGLTFTSEVEGLEILSDQMLNKVFHNLIDNTIRHGGKARMCGLSYEHDGNWLVLHYRDDGVGIPAEEKSLVFERGYGKNTGLGLFLVREILSITGMEIAEMGVPGQGVDFAIRVPPGGFRLRSGKAP